MSTAISQSNSASISRSTIIFMAICTGLIVANIYYCQPLIILIAKEFMISESYAGHLNYITQAGYATGLFLLVPLGDKFERKNQILITTAISIIALIMAALSKNFFLLQVAGFFIGATSIVPQLILPLAANLSSDQNRGYNIGIIMSGLLIGILASRAISGSIGYLLGWRSVFLMAGGICALLCVIMAKQFPKSYPSFKGSFLGLYSTMFGYLKSQPILREASLINFFGFALISAFWTVMVLYLANPPYNFETLRIGLFGIAGAAGALAAPLVGKLSNSKNPRTNLKIGFVLQILSVLLFLLSGNLIVFIIGIILIDIGQQAIHVTNQTRIYLLIPAARNRLNTVFMSVSFIGASCGSALGIYLWELNGWFAFCIGSFALILINFILYYVYKRKSI
ncbi:MFS transporter [Pedobacter flavus]|uniref:MFS transporter n=1 Tax=Pedobacter flavus TaxID=3113906 RepID=A0ABU7H0R1_9SPHI|nr:MFS transporter [Pedobacter sp. VNH31]MEE1884914.1 MFS transporter [Pedobacter sp. VNH31]